MVAGWLYMMTNKPNGILHLGSTIDIARRTWEHRTGPADGFTKRYGLTRLILRDNPDRDDPYDRLL